MNAEFPGAVPEIPVSDLDAALDYYARRLGFTIDWGDPDGNRLRVFYDFATPERITRTSTTVEQARE